MIGAEVAGRFIAGLVGIACAGSVFAGAITVSPTRIELTAHHPIATLEVRNEGSEPITLQLERMAWTQEDGQDVYAANASLVATPSVFELAPHRTQVLRIALRDGAPGAKERAYRVYASEVPGGREPSEPGSGLRMALRIGIPVFVPAADTGTRLDAEITPRSDGSAAIRVRNLGGHFARAFRVDVRDARGELLWQTRDPAYLLAGGEHLWPVESPLAARLAGAAVRFSITTETGTEDVDPQRHP